MLNCKGHSVELLADGKRISLDCGGENAFVSHAHADHAVRKAGSLLCSKATLDLMQARGYSPQCANAASEFKQDDLCVTLSSSGHVLGSAQLHAKWDSTSFTYTSDFKLGDSLTCSGAKVAKCEELLIEATYGLPRYRFPPREQTRKEMADWAKRRQSSGDVVLLGGYSLGKAQEIVKLLNDYCDTAPIVPKDIVDVCRIYTAHGVKLDFLDAESNEGIKAMKHSFTAVIPHHKMTPQLASDAAALYCKRVSCAVATGWAMNSVGSERFKSFCLSDHADYSELVRYAEESGAKKVFTTHGYATELAADLRKKGINAIPLGQGRKQKTRIGL